MFTTIADTIGWSVLPRPLFLRLFRHDLSVAPLFRNFLLADRLMREVLTDTLLRAPFRVVVLVSCVGWSDSNVLSQPPSHA